MKRILGALVALISSAVIGATLAPVQLLNPAGSTSGQAIVSTGSGTAPAWGNVTATALSPVAANTVIANATGASAAPTAHAVPSCSTANSALKWTSGTGLSCGTTFALTGGNLSQFALTTSAQLAGVLSDETGTGSAVFSASPTFTGTVNAAAVTTTGAITPSQTAGIVGTTTNNDANAGSVGEYLTASTQGTSASSGVALNATSVNLTAGDWEVSGICQYNAAGTTTSTQWVCGISTTSSTFGTAATGINNYFLLNGTSADAGSGENFMAPVTRIRISSTTTVYLVAQTQFAVSTMTVSGFIRARRVR